MEKLSRRMSSASFGIHSENKRIAERRKMKSRHRRINIAIATATLLLLICAVSFLVLHVVRSSEGEQLKKFGLNATLTEDLKGVQSAGLTAGRATVRDIKMVPQSAVERRADEHPNHRYEDLQSKDEIMDRMMKNIHYQNGRSPRPFTQHYEEMNKVHSLNNIQDIIHQEKQPETVQKPEVRPTVIPMTEISPFRLRGVYMRPGRALEGAPEEQGPEIETPEIEERAPNVKGPEEINQLADLESFDLVRKGMPFGKNFAKDEAYTRAIYHPYDENQPIRDLQKSWTKNLVENAGNRRDKKKKPLTVMLDIYPMAKPEDDTAEGFAESSRPGKEMLLIPMRPGEEFFQPAKNFLNKPLHRYLLPPNQRRRQIVPRKRMLMHLNLMGGGRGQRRRNQDYYQPQNDHRVGEVFQGTKDS